MDGASKGIGCGDERPHRGCAGRSTLQGWLLGVDRFALLLAAARFTNIESAVYSGRLCSPAQSARSGALQSPQFDHRAAIPVHRHSVDEYLQPPRLLRCELRQPPALRRTFEPTVSRARLQLPAEIPDRAHRTLPIYFTSNFRTEFTV